jgi:hypothetical protein
MFKPSSNFSSGGTQHFGQVFFGSILKEELQWANVISFQRYYKYMWNNGENEDDLEAPSSVINK